VHHGGIFLKNLTYPLCTTHLVDKHCHKLPKFHGLDQGFQNCSWLIQLGKILVAAH